MASKKARIAAVSVAVLVLAGVVAGSVIRDSSSKVAVQVQKIERRDLVSLVSASGEVKPKRYVNIGSNPSGRIVQLLVKEGDRVKRGQVLARIEAERYEAGNRQSEAAVQGAKAELDRAIADMDVARLAFERNQQMHKERLVSDQAFDQAQADFKMRQAGGRVAAPSHRPAPGPARQHPRRPAQDHRHLAHGRGGHEPAQGRGRGGDRRPELQPHRDHDRGRPLGDGVRDHGGRDRHPPPEARPARRGAGGRPRRHPHQGRGHRDRLLGGGAGHLADRGPDHAPPATPPTRPRTSRSRSRSRSRPPRSVRA